MNDFFGRPALLIFWIEILKYATKTLFHPKIELSKWATI